MKTMYIELQATHYRTDGKTYQKLHPLEVMLQPLARDLVILKELITKDTMPYLLEIQHQKNTTLIDVTGVVPYELWYFDADLQFTGKAFSLHQGSGSFQVQTQAKYILVGNQNSDYFEKIKNVIWSSFLLEKDSLLTRRNFPQTYGKFPYLIVKHFKSPCFTQIPIQINPLEKEFFDGHIVDNIPDEVVKDANLVRNVLKEHAHSFYLKLIEEQGDAIKLSLVIDEKEAYYYTTEGIHQFNTSIPAGGVLLSTSGRQIANGTKHYV